MMKPTVFVTRKIADRALERIAAACDMNLWDSPFPPPRDALLNGLREADGILTMLSDRMDGAAMGANPRLKVISQMAVGYDNIDLDAARVRKIAVGNTPDAMTDATADIAWALLLATARRIVESVAYIQNGEWKAWEPRALLGVDLVGKTLGIVGFGRIGRAVARRARGWDMRVLAYSPSLTDDQARAAGVEYGTFDDLLKQSDFVSLHVPLNAETRHLIRRETLALMRPSAILINTARGGVIDQMALIEALQNRIISAAGLDVTDPEPIPDDHPLMRLPNAVVIPHIGSATLETRERMAMMAADNLIAGVNGQPLPYPLVQVQTNE